MAGPATTQVENADVLRLSVVICSHNGSARLETTLKHLAAQTGITGDRWEIVLVDNASSDGTAEQARSIWRSLDGSAALRVVAEPKLGVIHARISGILAARYDIVSFVDDDNWVCPTWCAKILGLMTDFPDIGAIACRSEAAFEPGQSVPAWFTYFQHGYAVGPQGDRTGPVATALPRYHTAGLCFRRRAASALIARGFTPISTGQFGKQLSAGEDAELCYALAMTGCRFWYEDSLRFAHYMPGGRLTSAYAEQLYYGLGVASSIEDLYLERWPVDRRTGLRSRLRRIQLLRYLNTSRQILRLRLRLLRSAKGSAAHSQARIEEKYYAGRLDGILRHRMSRDAFEAQIACWATPAIS